MLNFKNIIALQAVLAILCACGSANSVPPKDKLVEARSLTIMSYNVRNTYGLDNEASPDRIAGVIKAQKPDYVALQELDSVTIRSQSHYMLKEIADRCGMNFQFAPAIEFQGGKYGIGLLSKSEPKRCYNIPLPGAEEPRTLLVAEFEKEFVCCFHLSLTPESQMESVEILKREFSKLSGKPIYIAGDWNSTPDSDFIKAIEKDFIILSDTAQPTFRADEPTKCIDYIAVSRPVSGIHSHNALVVPEPVASDHRPVVVRLSVNP